MRRSFAATAADINYNVLLLVHVVWSVSIFLLDIRRWILLRSWRYRAMNENQKGLSVLQAVLTVLLLIWPLTHILLTSSGRSIRRLLEPAQRLQTLRWGKNFRELTEAVGETLEHPRVAGSFLDLYIVSFA